VIRSLLTVGILIAACVVMSPIASGQEWARKMFPVTDHDFGTVARGSEPEFAFTFTNPYEEPIEIAEVRTSCGCTTPQITKRRLQTWEKSSIIATLNTRSFTGHKQATLTVVISKPFPAEVQLNIKGTIRSDVVFEPWQVDFHEIGQGQVAQRKVLVTHAGNANWQIADVRSANTHLEVELLSEQRVAGRVACEMLIRLKADAPVGYFQDQLTLVTNDAENATIVLPVQGRVTSPLTISPASLFLGVLLPGQSVTKRLVIRGNEPFRVLQVECGNEAFAFGPSGQFEASDSAKPLHFVPVTFQAGQSIGEVLETIRVVTDLGGGAAAECKASATVQGRVE
jgi:hypothetical protein